MCLTERDTWSGPDYRRELARIYVMVGEYGKALEELRQLIAVPNRWVSAAVLQLDPRWAPIRELPGFNALLEHGADQ